MAMLLNIKAKGIKVAYMPTCFIVYKVSKSKVVRVCFGFINSNMDLRQNGLITNPFEKLKIDDWSVLESIDCRSTCSNCGKSRKYFCYSCYIPVPAVRKHIPNIKLPVKIDIIKHTREIDGKSTAAHVAILAPDDVKIYKYPSVPDYGEGEGVVLIYPGKTAVTLKEFIESHMCHNDKDNETHPSTNSGKLPIKKVVFIDGTWSQSRGMFKHEKLKILPCITLVSRISQFWRHQKKSPRWYLSTVEAIHEFLVELHIANSLYNLGYNTSNFVNKETLSAKHLNNGLGSTSLLGSLLCNGTDNMCLDQKCLHKKQKETAKCTVTEEGEENLYNGEYDNLLYFFSYMYFKIHQLYRHDDLRAYKRPLK